MVNKVLHKRSVVVNDGKPKLPTSAQTEYGEININYANGYETLSIRNNADEIVPFSSDNKIKEWIYEGQVQLISSLSGFSAVTESGSAVDALVLRQVIEENEIVVSLALNELNDNVNSLSSTTQGIDNRVTALETATPDNPGITGITMNGSAATISNDVADLGNVVTEIIINESAKTISGGSVNLGNYMPIEDEVVISAALNDLNDRILILSSNTMDYLTGDDLNEFGFVTSGQVQVQIDNSISGIPTEFKTINNESIIGTGNITIQGGGGDGASYSAGTNIDITNNVISVTGLSIPTSNTAFTNEAGYVEESEIEDFVTSADTKTQIEGYNYVTSAQTKTQIENYNYITSAAAQTQINTTLNGYATEQWVGNQGYLTQHQSLSGTVASASYVSSAKTINFYNSNNVVLSSIDATDFIKDGMVDNVSISGADLVVSFNTDSGKDNIVIPLTGIFNPNNYYTKTDIDNKNYTTSAATKTQIEGYHYVTSAQTKTQIEGYNYTTSAKTKTQIESYGYITSSSLPTVNNATLTIQKNGTSVATFTANAASNVTANVTVNELPTVTSSNNGQILQVVNGVWTLVNPINIYTGSNAPQNSLGNNGDLYFQI